MSEKLISLFMAIYLFFACLPYGNQPVKVELSYEVKTTQAFYTEGDKVSIQTYSKNVGRPFYGYQFRCMTCEVFQMVDGNRQSLSVVSMPGGQPAAVNGKMIIKHGDIQYGGFEAVLQDNVPGFYSMEVTYETYDGTVFTKLFEDVIEIR